MLLPILALATLAQVDVSSAAPLPAGPRPAPKPALVRLTETGLVASNAARDGRHVAFLVSEVEQGGLDLNADGDGNDAVVHVFDALDGSVRNLGLASMRPDIGGALVVFSASEPGEGADLNGDGDQLDAVPFAFDLASRTLTSSGTSGTAYPATSTGLGFVIEESDAGVDLNGDGDLSDDVMHHWNLALGAITNLGLAVVGEVVPSGASILFEVPESGIGDLNGDGDSIDTVYHALDTNLGVAFNTGLTTAIDAVASNGLEAFLVFEFYQGNQDLNGDGDTADHVLFLFDQGLGTLRNLGVAVERDCELLGHGLQRCAPSVRLGPDRAAFLVSEFAQGRQDLNGDGDAVDHVLGIYTSSARSLENLGVAAHDYQLDETLIAFDVREAEHGAADLNGDGDTLDLVAAVRSFETGLTTNLGLARTGLAGAFESNGYEVANGRVAFKVNETSQGADANDDGDILDNVYHLFDSADGSIANSKRAGKTISHDFILSATALLMGVSEAESGALDLNSDGDTGDIVIASYSPRTRRTIDSGSSMAFFPLTLFGRSHVFLSSEASEGGADLNGDGDADDEVLRSVWLRP